MKVIITMSEELRRQQEEMLKERTPSKPNFTIFDVMRVAKEGVLRKIAAECMFAQLRGTNDDD